MRYTLLIDGEAGGYGVVVPDMPGCTAMGDTIEEALFNAADAMRDWAEAIEETGGRVPAARRPEQIFTEEEDVRAALAAGATLASAPLIRASGRPARANLSLDAGVLATIDAEAKRRNMTRSGFIEFMARQFLPEMA